MLNLIQYLKLFLTRRLPAQWTISEMTQSGRLKQELRSTWNYFITIHVHI